MKGVTRGTKRPPRVCLYGPPGVGKSTFGADSDKPIFVCTEDGVDNIPVDSFGNTASWTELIKQIQRVGTEKHDYRTIVIDTLNGATDLASRHVCDTMFGGIRTAKKGSEGFMSWGQGWRATAEEFRPFLAALDVCRTKGLTVILLAHAGLHAVKTPSDGDYNKFAADVDKSVWAKVSAWADIILRAEYETTILAKDSGKGKVISTNIRKMYAAGSAAQDCKVRVGYDLPDEMELSYKVFSEYLGKGDSVLSELQDLFKSLPADRQKKAMAWAGVTQLSDLTAAKAKEMLNQIRKAVSDLQPKEKE